MFVSILVIPRAARIGLSCASANLFILDFLSLLVAYFSHMLLAEILSVSARLVAFRLAILLKLGSLLELEAAQRRGWSHARALTWPSCWTLVHAHADAWAKPLTHTGAHAWTAHHSCLLLRCTSSRAHLVRARANQAVQPTART